MHKQWVKKGSQSSQMESDLVAKNAPSCLNSRNSVFRSNFSLLPKIMSKQLSFSFCSWSNYIQEQTLHPSCLNSQNCVFRSKYFPLLPQVMEYCIQKQTLAPPGFPHGVFIQELTEYCIWNKHYPLLPFKHFLGVNIILPQLNQFRN